MFYKLNFMCLFFICSSLFATNLENMKTFEAEFSQIIINSSSKKIEYTGKIYIKEPSKIVWKYVTPIVKNVYIDKSFAIVDEPELEQAIFTSLKNEINIVKLLKNAKKIDEKNYTTTMYNTEYKITIENNRIKTIKYQDEIENDITIIFTNIKQNHEIDSKHFKFKPPFGYDIIRK